MNKKVTYSLISVAVLVAMYFLYCFFMKKEGFYYPINPEDCELDEFGKPLISQVMDIGEEESNDKISSRQFEKAFPYSEESVIPSV